MYYLPLSSSNPIPIYCGLLLACQPQVVCVITVQPHKWVLPRPHCIQDLDRFLYQRLPWGTGGLDLTFLTKQHIHAYRRVGGFPVDHRLTQSMSILFEGRCGTP